MHVLALGHTFAMLKSLAGLTDVLRHAHAAIDIDQMGMM